jgi:peroxiredoxin 2/4
MNVSGKVLVLSLAATLFGGAVFTARAGVVTPPCGSEPCGMHRHDRMGCRTVAKVGEPAPDFTLEAVVGKEFKKISLADYRGKWVVLFFYPLDFTFVCPTEIKGFNEHLKEFEKLNAVILGASVDSKWSHKAWIEKGDLGKLQFPLLSDFNKTTARIYGILDEKDGVALRGLFIIDDKGTLQYESVNNLSVGRSIDETLRILEALQTGELCPINWKPGQKTLGK